MKSLIQQTNSLVNLGDILIIKTPLPINFTNITILGYEVITQDIVDLRDWVGGWYAISPVSADIHTTINSLNWKILDKGLDGTSIDFVNDCASQIENFYIYFKFQKLATSGQIINITKVNLKIRDSSALEELKTKYPYYYQSLFNGFNPNDENVLAWQYNVLEKVSGDSILPHYIEKDKDFSIFWGWITHFFALIVHFCRKFKDIFSNYLNYLDDVGEFMKEKDYIRDSRVQIDKDLKISLSEELVYAPIIGQRISTSSGYPVATSNYDFSGYLLVHQGNVLILKVGGYNKNSDTYNGSALNVDVAYYYKNYNVASHSTIALTASEAKNGKRLLVPSSNGEQIMYVAISYPKLGSFTLPLFVQVFIEGEGIYSIEDRDERGIFDTYKDFRKRGTFKSNSLIKKILEVKKEDGFHADYVNTNNVGWFLNRNSPVSVGHLNNYILIDSVVPKAQTVINNNRSDFFFLDQFLIFNQNTSIIIKWKSSSNPQKVNLKLSFYDKNGNKLGSANSIKILGNWVYDSTWKGYKSDFENLGTDDAVVLTPKYNSTLGYYYVEMPINIIGNIGLGGCFQVEDYDKNFFVDNEGNSTENYLITKTGHIGPNTAVDVSYIKIDFVAILHDGTNDAILNNNLLNLEIGLYLRKLPFNLGFLNNKQYFLCNFKNNGSYSDEEAKVLIDQKVLPYNGLRLWVDNSKWYNDVNLPLELEDAYFDKNLNQIYIKVKGGMPPYSYKFDTSTAQSSYDKIYTKILTTSQFGIHKVKITDFLGNTVNVKLSCQTYNDIDFKMRVWLDIDQNISSQIFVYGGTEKSYKIIWLRSSSNYGSLIIPAKNWVSLDKLGNSHKFNTIDSQDTLNIIDNGDTTRTLQIKIKDLFADIALDIYDNGQGEPIN